MQRVYLILFEIFIVVMLAFVVIKKVSTVSADYQKRFLSKDVALMIDAAYASPIPFEYEYGFPGLSKQEVTFQKQYVDVTGRSYPFAQDLTVRSDFALPQAESFRFKREPGLLDFNHVRFIPEKLPCPAVKAPLGRLVIDPAHGLDEARAKDERQKTPGITDEELAALGLGEPGNTGKDADGNPVLESELTYRVAAALDTASRGLLGLQDVRLTRKRPDASLSIQDRAKELAGATNPVLVSLHAGTAARPQEVPITAYVNGRGSKLTESTALACQAINAILEKYPFPALKAEPRVAIIPVDIRLLPRGDPLGVLPEGQPGVALELGNIQNPGDPLLKDVGGLAGTIAGGLQAAVERRG
jgi:N-acetylmuramoyl-L-alanine amidase